MSNTTYVCAIDIGVRNLSFYIEEVDLDSLLDIPQIHKKERYEKNGELTDDMRTQLKAVYKTGKTTLYNNSDITGYKNDKKVKWIDPVFFYNTNDHLDTFKEYWEKCEYILIEKQMQFGNKVNKIALKMAQHIYSYFTIKHDNSKQIIEFPAYHKTKLLGAEKGITKPKRKKFCITKMYDILSERDEMEILINDIHNKKKQDDIADCLCMIQCWKLLVRDKKMKLTEKLKVA